MDDLKIELKDGYSALKAIYFRDGRESIFTNRATKWGLTITLIIACLSALFYMISLLHPEENWITLFEFCSLITIVMVIFSFILIIKYLLWKKPIEKYLNGLRKYESQWLTLTDRNIELTNSDSTSIEKWEAIKFISIQQDFISISSDYHSSFIFPAKSMEPNQYIALAELIKLKMKDNPSKISEV
jgi:hypothetical protein